MTWQPSLLSIPPAERHLAAQAKARTAGACWPCCWEAGMRATDDEVPRERQGEMHQECSARIARGSSASRLT